MRSHKPSTVSTMSSMKFSTRQLLLCTFQLFIFSCLEAAVRGTEVSLEPSDVHVDVGNMANFTCNVSCSLSQTHTIRWLVGDSPSGTRIVDEDFEQRTGIQVIVSEILSCATSDEGGIAQQILRVNVSSVERLNRTAVQCAAQRKSPSFSDLYSHYGVIVVNGELEATTPSYAHEETVVEPSQTEDPSLTTTGVVVEPSPCLPVSVTVTESHTVTLTVTQTVMVTNQALPLNAQAVMNPSNSGSTASPSSLLLIMFSLFISYFAYEKLT